MYDAILFIHVAGALGTFLFHGAVASVTFALRRERPPELLPSLSGVLDIAVPWSRRLTAVTVVSGLVLMVMGGWWREAWVWLSLLVLFAVGVVMFVVGQTFYWIEFGDGQIPKTSDRWYRQIWVGESMGSRTPILLTVTGLLSLGTILWLMMFKPF